MAKVYVKFNTAVIQEVVLDKNEISFGRKSDNDIVIDHPTVSGHHGRLRKQTDHFVVEDLNSTNGTFINGRRIKSGAIKDRDQIGVAGHILDFYINDEIKIPLTVPDPAASKESPSSVSKTAENPPADKPMSAAPPPPLQTPGDVMKIRIISGAVDGQAEIALKERITYIGTKAPATIKIKGFLAPDLAAAITQGPDGYFFKSIKAGYSKVNGIVVHEQILLDNGAAIEVGGTNMVFLKTH